MREEHTEGGEEASFKSTGNQREKENTQEQRVATNGVNDGAEASKL